MRRIIIWKHEYITLVTINTPNNMISRDFDTFIEAENWIRDIFETEEYEVINCEWLQKQKAE